MLSWSFSTVRRAANSGRMSRQVVVQLGGRPDHVWLIFKQITHNFWVSTNYNLTWAAAASSDQGVLGLHRLRDTFQPF